MMIFCSNGIRQLLSRFFLDSATAFIIQNNIHVKNILCAENCWLFPLKHPAQQGTHPSRCLLLTLFWWWILIDSHGWYQPCTSENLNPQLFAREQWNTPNRCTSQPYSQREMRGRGNVVNLPQPSICQRHPNHFHQCTEQQSCVSLGLWMPKSCAGYQSALHWHSGCQSPLHHHSGQCHWNRV